MHSEIMVQNCIRKLGHRQQGLPFYMTISRQLITYYTEIRLRLLFVLFIFCED